jgi:flagella basal body P-ring formation protein FlgA
MVTAFEHVVMSRRALNKNTILQKEDIYTTLADASRIQKGAARKEEDVLGKGLTRGIGTNVVLTEVMVSQYPEVKRGQKVMLVVDAPGFTIRGAGELQQGGFVGNYVKVINGQSHKAVTGLLVDEHTVKVGL